jgi:hypothetical protein
MAAAMWPAATVVTTKRDRWAERLSRRCSRPSNALRSANRGPKEKARLDAGLSFYG